MLHKTKAAGIAAAVAMGVTLSGYLSYAAGGTYFTYVDNANNTNNLISPANSNSNTTPDNDMATNNLATMTETSAPSATYGNGTTIEFNINNTGAAPTTSVSLTIRAWDVDEEQGETDNVYLNGHLLGKLTGANNVWSTTVYNISNLSWVIAGNNLVQIKPDVNNAGWVTGARWGQILIDGGAADKGDTGTVTITGCVTRAASVAGCTVNSGLSDPNIANPVQINTSTSIHAITGGNYRLEVTIIDPNGNSTSVLTQNFTAAAGATVVRTASPTYDLGGVSGTYSVQAQLFYIDSSSFPVQQDIATTQFVHTQNVGPTDLDNDGLSNTQETTLGTSPVSTDTDGDGIADNTEVGGNVNAPVDTDGDGIIDALESNTLDTDGDGQANSADTDSDNDGIPDSVERGAGLTPVDTDGDGTPDYLDRDSDNDTLPDALEAGTTPATPADTDSDGKKDYLDLDSDGDRLPDRIEGGSLGVDTDNDGIDNAFDVSTQGGTDANLDGIRDGLLPRNTDGDAVADFREVDSDNDGILDRLETNLSNTDTDGDGIDNAIDVTQTAGADANGDGIDDAYVLPDTDSDGLPDYRDLDADNDGIADVTEAGLVDANRDGLLDAGSPVTANPRNTDGDALADYRDLDDDADTLLDTYEAGGIDANRDGRIDGFSDTNNNGLADSVETARGGTPLSLPNADGDANPNYIDTDSDGDGASDLTEVAGTPATPPDTDGDGIINAYESSTADADGDGVTDQADADSANPCVPDASSTACLAIDSDGDGLSNGQEAALGTNANNPDTDGDGESDGAERGGATLPLDADADGIPDALESSITDSDNDGSPNETDRANADPCIPNASSTACLALDNDGDGLTNGQEAALGTNPNSTDSDGDGIADNVEVGGNTGAPLDSDGDGIINALESATTDTDGDGVPNSTDADSDNDGIPDAVERGTGTTPIDTDGDGAANYLDRDSDNDTIPDALEAGATPAAPVDTDNDGKKDYLDLDSDADGLPDRLEGGGLGVDTDADGIDNAYDVNIQGGVDANRDGITDGRSPRDTDGDGKADFRDVDTDNDGILDTAEGSVAGVDTDGDGIDNALDTDITGGADLNGDRIDDAYVLPNRDGDAVADFRDLDTDNDSITDVIEAGLADANGDGLLDAGGTPTMAPRDTDNDGIGDFREVDSNNDGTPDIAGTANAASDANHDGRVDVITDTDGDGIANVVDRAPTLFGASIDTDGDGIGDVVDLDDDNDGIPDTQDGTGDFDGDGIINALDRDSDNDGLTDTVEGGGTDANRDGVIDGFVDTNGNGLSDRVEAALAGTALLLPDTDNDGNRNFLDLDSDADGLSDNLESGGIDANNDGRVDTTTDTDGDGLMDSVDGSINGSVPVVPVDTDADGLADYVDVDSDNDGVSDSREGRMDSDGDGIPDYRDQPGKLETALRGVGSFEGWFVLMLGVLLALRLPRVRQLLLATSLLVVTGGSLRAETPADYQGKWYAGGDVGLSWLEPRNVDGGYRIDDKTSTGYRLLVGNQVFADWSVEGFYIKTGKAGVSSDNPSVGHLGDVKYTLYGVGTEWTPFMGGRTATFYPLLKAGAVLTSNSTNSPYIQYDKLHGVGLYFGAAGVWQFSRTWRAQLEATSYDKDELMVTLGLRKIFGARQPAAVHEAAPAPQPVQAVAASAPVVSPQPVVMPPAAPPADTDHDGVIDSADQCPATPANDKVDGNGCSLSIRLQVYFDNDSGRLKPESYTDLERIIEFMKLVPGTTGELQGHTDNVGKDSYNLSLSQKRADSVKAYMVSKGIAAERLRARGYGEAQPVASNDTTGGRAENRRVLFVRTDVK